MNNFITIDYHLKENTSTSFYCGIEQQYLPNRLSYTSEYLRQTRQHGTKEVIGQIKGTFKKSESGYYKKHKPYHIHTNLKPINSEVFDAKGDIGFTKANGKLSGSNDLLLVQVLEKGTLLRVFIFFDQASEALSVIQSFNNKVA